MQEYAPEPTDDPFAHSRELFEAMIAMLASAETAQLTHAQIEDTITTRGRELYRSMLQDHLDLRALREVDHEHVVGAEGVERTRTETGHHRKLTTVFGQVSVERKAYRALGAPNLHPADAALSLPVERHSHGLRKLAALESARGSFEDAAQAVSRATGTPIGKRQVEQLAARAAGDVCAFYEARERRACPASDALVISADGKGIVMRPEALRPQTARAASNSGHKLQTRLSRGEKRNRKRMAEVGAVYDLTPVVRAPADIIGSGQPHQTEPTPGPKARDKWLTASVHKTTAEVIAAVFDEACRRDPAHRRPWVALVDGNAHQISRIQADQPNATSRSASSWTSSTCWNTYGKRPGASSPKATPPPRDGLPVTPCASWKETRVSSPRRSGARPPPTAFPPTNARQRTYAPTTSSRKVLT